MSDYPIQLQVEINEATPDPDLVWVWTTNHVREFSIVDVAPTAEENAAALEAWMAENPGLVVPGNAYRRVVIQTIVGPDLQVTAPEPAARASRKG